MAATERQRFELAIEGMTCSACAARVQRALVHTDGVTEAAVNFAVEQALVHIDPAQTDLQSIIAVVQRCGYQAHHESDQVKQAERAQRQAVRERRAILAAAVLTAPFLAQMAITFGLGDAGRGLHLPPWAELALALPLQFGLGWRFYRGAVNALHGGWANMDVLVALGTTAAFAYSLYLLLALGAAAQGQLYFEASAVIITLVLVGKHLEARAKRGATAAVQELLALQPDTALVRLPNGGTEQRPCQGLRPGDLVVCRPGDRVAVDGIILRGEAAMDEALISGESNPVAKAPGDLVTAGAINLDGFIDIETRAVGADSTLAKMIRMVENAQAGKPAVQRLVDRVSAVFVPAVIALAVVTFLSTWLFADGGLETAIVNAAATLVIACPCALGLATPTAIMTGTGAAVRAGILFKDTASLEHAHRLSHVIFDKTGTLTEGKPTVAHIDLLAERSAEEVLAVAATLQQGSEHPIASAFREAAAQQGLQLAEVVNFKSRVSRGIEGEVRGVHYLLGNDRLFRQEGSATPPGELGDLPGNAGLSQQEGLVTPPQKPRRGGAEVWLGARREAGDALLARFELVDQLRPTAKAAVDELKRLQLKTLLVSGDANAVARRIGKELGIDDVRGEARPEDKTAIIAQLANQGAKVGMVGDGLNDAPALAQADVGIALSTGVDAAMETAAITLMRPDPRLVATAIDASRRTFRKIKQNLFWAFAYNVVALPLAALGYLTPSLAAAAMALSSLSVIANSLTLRFWKPNLEPPPMPPVPPTAAPASAAEGAAA